MAEEIDDPFKRLFKYAGDYALYLGGFIAFFFLLDLVFPNNGFVGLLTMFGFLTTPVLCYHLAKNYRDRAWGGYIRFGQVWSFGVLLFFFAALIMSVLYYVRYQFLQPNALSVAFNQTITMMQQVPNYPQKYIDAAIAFGVPTAIQVVLFNVWWHIIGGGILFLILSPMIAKKNDILPPSDQHYKPYQDTKDSDEEPKA